MNQSMPSPRGVEGTQASKIVPVDPPAWPGAPALSEGAEKVYRLLWYYFRLSLAKGKTYVWPSQETLADKLGRSIRQVKRNLLECERKGRIKRTRTREGNRYYLLENVPCHR